MMAYDKFLIAPFDENSGLTNNMKPWQIPDSAWAVMDNAYVFRGRIKKRFGSRYMGSGADITNVEPLFSRLRLQVGTVGAPMSPVPGHIFQVGQFFSIGDQEFTVITAGVAQPMLSTGPGTGTFSTTDGSFIFAGTGLPGGTPIYFYPSLPVMGFAQYEFAPINNFPSFAFDPEFAYIFTGGAWQLSAGSPTWHGDDTNFFYSSNWVGLDQSITTLERTLFTTNFQVTNINGIATANDDPIYYYNNVTWTAFTPYYFPNGGAPQTGPFVETARIILPFKGRLLLLNTIENDNVLTMAAPLGTNTNYVNRVRYSFKGSPFWNNSFYQQGQRDNSGNPDTSIGTTASFLDAGTLEAIVGAEFIKDRLIVYFEQSTWKLAFTGNEENPFEWQKLNTELGSMATFSTVGFDKAVLAIGETGVHSCNGSNVIRIDQKIPSEIFGISNPFTETERICGIRDFYAEMVYWSIPVSSQESNQPFPTRVLVYNYQNQTWAFNDDCITAFGYFDGQPALTWATITGTWDEWNSTWDSGDMAQQVRQVIAGNQQGFTFVIDTEGEQTTRNAGVLQISGMVQVANGIQLTIYNHMLKNGDYIFIENEQGVVLAGQKIYVVQVINMNTVLAFYPIEVVITRGDHPTFTGVYTGGGTVARVSNYNLQSKQWNPYDKDGSNVYVAKIDFAVLKTPAGQVTINYSPSSTPFDEIMNGIGNNSLIGTSVLETSPYDPALYPLEQTQNRLWHPIYFQTDGECIQIQIYMSPLQICTRTIAFSDFEIEGMVLNTKKTSSRLQ